ncbi:unnamed protein product (macronuclear) [Paramecium tetraurelia]|uniref:Uncharacterized protein n=1 Tax=Paramecium tetraurelia TaxID=5888 RepID=A0DNJ9_PARTE|nr:uncharacterized protein GSPATT00018812001 [Paramecium tetraurelia]CAK84616.1 unnamed protein product [Paramecium tetraurelia]|eukprot:XP_001452013.1 hypothetical protein (macronuclear) [Paramecium tetraurelia strain d4-2]
MLNIKTEESYESNSINRYDSQMQNQDRKFVLHANLNEISRKQYNQERKLVLPQIKVPHSQTEQSEESPGIQMFKNRLECVKLPEIDEKFFIRKSFNIDLMNKPKVYSHSHQVSREEYEFANSEKNIDALITKKVDFQDDVMVYDYVNQTCKKDCIKGQGKSIKMRRQKTRKLSDDLTQTYKQNLRMNNLLKLNPKSHFFEENSKESQKVIISENLMDDNI